MAEVRIPSAPRGEIARMEDQTASSTTPIDIEIKPDAPCKLLLVVNKQSGEDLVVKRRIGSSGAFDVLVASGVKTANESVTIEDIEMKEGDELWVDLDGTVSGARIVSAEARRLN